MAAPDGRWSAGHRLHHLTKGIGIAGSVQRPRQLTEQNATVVVGQYGNLPGLGNLGVRGYSGNHQVSHVVPVQQFRRCWLIRSTPDTIGFAPLVGNICAIPERLCDGPLNVFLVWPMVPPPPPRSIVKLTGEAGNANGRVFRRSGRCGLVLVRDL